MVLRSDEIANQSEIERDGRFRSNLGKGVSAVASAAVGAASPAIASRVMPFLNQYIPATLAMKGISKVSPKLGAFLQRGQDMGLDLEEGLSFIKDNFSKSETKSKADLQGSNLIDQYDPELTTYLKEKIRKGMPLLEAGKKALGHDRFKKAVDKMTKEHKAPWESILEAVFGSTANQQTSQQPTQQIAQPQTQNLPQVAQQNQVAQQQAPGAGQQALMSAIQKLQQIRGGGA